MKELLEARKQVILFIVLAVVVILAALYIFEAFGCFGCNMCGGCGFWSCFEGCTDCVNHCVCG